MKKIFLILFLTLILNKIHTGANIDVFDVPQPDQTSYKPANLAKVTSKELSVENGNGKLTIKTYGYIKHEQFWDTRQTFGLRGDMFLLWPERFLPDVNGVDINAPGEFNFTAIESRFGFSVTGAEYSCGVKASAVLEADFLGLSEDTISLFRLRHAYALIDLTGIQANFLAGKYWHPLFVLECFANTISFNNGAPIDIYSRMSQIRYTQRWGHAQLILAALCEPDDFDSPGPNGFITKYMRDSKIPNLHAQTKFYFLEDKLVSGLAFDYKRLVPRLVTDKNFATTAHVDSFIGEAYFAYNSDRGTFRTKGWYAQNGADQATISGYAVKTIDPITDIRTYTPTQAAGAWIDTSYNITQKSSLGLFFGGAKNLGSVDRVEFDPKTNQPIVYAIDPEIDYVVRVSPRYLYQNDPIRVGVEIEFTRAAFGKLDHNALPINPRPVNNVRFDFAIYYVF